MEETDMVILKEDEDYMDKIFEDDDKYDIVHVDVSQSLSCSGVIKVPKGYDGDLTQFVVDQMSVPSAGSHWFLDEFEVIADR